MSKERIKSGKAKLFVENLLVYGLGGVISKVVPLIMLPIITHLMPNTTYFGISDLSNTIVSFGGALAVFGMYDAMYRLFFDKTEEQYRKQVCSTTMVFTIGMSLIIAILIIAEKDIIARYIFKDDTFSYLVYIAAATILVSATNQIVSAPTRMQNKRGVFLVTNTITPILSYAIAILLIKKGYYVIALPVAALCSGFSMELVFLFLNRKWFVPTLFDRKLLKQLFVIALPLVPNFLVYWIFNSCDKLMITTLLSVGEEGIYSVGSKLGHASQLIYVAFAGGWQFFAFSTMKEDGQVESNSKVFEYLGVISYITSMFVFVFAKWVFYLFFPEAYAFGYIVAPYLFMAPLIQMLFQIASNQFLVIKKTWPSMLILLGGAGVNIILNFVLIPLIGIEGAAVATLMGYLSSVIVCCSVLIKKKQMIISKRFVFASCLTMAYIIVWRILLVDCLTINLLFMCVIVASFVVLYRKEVTLIVRKINSK